MKSSERKQIVKAVNTLLDSVTSLVEAVDSVSRRAASAAGAAAPRGKGRRGGARGSWTPQRTERLRKSIAGYWAKLTPAQHKERVRKMLAGRGLKPKRGRPAK